MYQTNPDQRPDLRHYEAGSFADKYVNPPIDELSRQVHEAYQPPVLNSINTDAQYQQVVDSRLSDTYAQFGSETLRRLTLAEMANNLVVARAAALKEASNPSTNVYSSANPRSSRQSDYGLTS